MGRRCSSRPKRSRHSSSSCQFLLSTGAFSPLSEWAHSTEDRELKRAKSSMCPSVSSPSMPEESQITSGVEM